MDSREQRILRIQQDLDFGRYAKAAQMAAEGLAREPTARDFKVLLMDALAYGERYLPALELCRELLVQDPEDVDALFHLPRLLAETGRPEEAASVARDLTAKNPDDPHYLAELAVILFYDLGRPATEVREPLRRCLSLDPHHAVACTVAFHLALHERDYTEMKDIVASMQRHDPAGETTARLTATMVSRLQPEDADHLRALIVADPTNEILIELFEHARRKDLLRTATVRDLLRLLPRGSESTMEFAKRLFAEPDAESLRPLAQTFFESAQDTPLILARDLMKRACAEGWGPAAEDLFLFLVSRWQAAEEGDPQALLAGAVRQGYLRLAEILLRDERWVPDPSFWAVDWPVLESVPTLVALARAQFPRWGQAVPPEVFKTR